MAEDVTFSIGEIATMIGMSAHTIRAWEKRYGAVAPNRTRGNQRRYTLEDIQRLVHVKHAASARGLSLKLAVLEQDGLLEPYFEPGRPVRHSPTGELEPLSAPWRTVADVLDDLLLIADPDGILIDANIAIAKAVGVVRQRLVGLRFADLIDPYDRAKAVTLFRKPLEHRSGWELNVRTRNLRGLYSFDSWPVMQAPPGLLVLAGRELHAQMEPQSRAS